WLLAFCVLGLTLLGYQLVGEWRLRPWKRHRFAGGDQVELARKQHRKASLLPGAGRNPAGGIASPPIDVGAGGTDGTRAGILRDHQPAEFGIGAAVVCNPEVRLDGRCKGVSNSSVQMPCRSGSPHGVFSAGVVAEPSGA